MGERELERKPTFPTPSIQAANRGIFKPCCRHKARRHSRSLTSALERGVQGIPSHGREARGWALTQSPLAGALVSCRTHPPGFQPRQGNFLEPCNHHHLAASFQRRMAGAWVLPGLRHPPPVQPLLCSCRSRGPRMWRGTRITPRVRSSEGPRARVSAEALPTLAVRAPAAEPPSRPGLGAMARARPLAGARGGPGPPAAASGDSSWQIRGIRQE